MHKRLKAVNKLQLLCSFRPSSLPFGSNTYFALQFSSFLQRLYDSKPLLACRIENWVYISANGSVGRCREAFGLPRLWRLSDLVINSLFTSMKVQETLFNLAWLQMWCLMIVVQLQLSRVKFINSLKRFCGHMTICKGPYLSCGLWVCIASTFMKDI